MRARLAASTAPNRIFEKVLEVCKSAGLVGRKRVLDSTPIYDAVATMDTVTLIRSAIRGVLKCAGAFDERVRAVLVRDDDYSTAGKPACDYDDPDARVALVDALAKDGMAVLAVLEGREVSEALAQAAVLLATVLGQDLDVDEAGVFRIVRRVAKDRVISTVDTEARHGHKTAARGFDGYKGHIGIDPDSEVITATEVTAGNAGDVSVAEDLITDLRDEHGDHPTTEDVASVEDTAQGATDSGAATDSVSEDVAEQSDAVGQETSGGNARTQADDGGETGTDPACVYGDNAYGTGPFHEHLEQAGIESKCKSQQPANTGGRFTKNDFDIDLDSDTVTCPASNTAPVRRAPNGAGIARFGPACAGCPLREQCTTSGSGRSIMIGLYEQQLAAARNRQRDPGWVEDYRGTRPKVERKIGHLMRRRHGGRRARVRGTTKLAADFALLAAAVNLARLGVLAVTSSPSRGWATAG